ncbi:hypothetical protein, partial [Methylobacterium platani]
LSDMVTTGRPVFISPGRYRSGQLRYPVSAAYSQMGSIFGYDKNLTQIRRIGDNQSLGLLTIGDPNATNFTANINISGLTLNGMDPNLPVLVTYDLVKSVLRQINCIGGSIGYQMYGGITNMLFDFNCDNNGTGLMARGFASKAGGGMPNHIHIIGAFGGNLKYGLDIDGGVNFMLDGCDVEGNGRTFDADSGGLLVGPNMGGDISRIRNYPGVTARNCWFEANKGKADVRLQSGLNAIEHSKFFSTPDATRHDVLIEGGNYMIVNCATGTAKTANLKDSINCERGNYVIGGLFPGVDLVRCSVLAAPTLHNINNPLNATEGLDVYNQSLDAHAGLNVDGPTKITGPFLNAGGVKVAASGGNYFVPEGSGWVMFTQTSTIASQGCILPAAAGDGHVIEIGTIGTITSLYVAAQGGATVIGTSSDPANPTKQGDPVTLTASTPLRFRYDAAGTRWLRT